MKSYLPILPLSQGVVTLHARVWIEMEIKTEENEEVSSPSTRGCGLKSNEYNICMMLNGVTLHARVWIEILILLKYAVFTVVTLHARVWIEIV